MPPPKSAAKRQPITLAQLSSYDDMLTDALVDHTYYWTTIPKNRPSYHASRGITEEEITKIIQSHVIVDPDLEIAESKLLATAGFRKFHNALRTPKEKDDFVAHLRRYLRMYLPDCPFEVSSTNRYTIYSHEAAITARKYIKKGQSIKYLAGIQVMITAKEDKELAKRKKDFSIVISARHKCAALFMGPARFANHDCNANARLMITGQAGIEIVATQNIDVGDEITVSYAENYFGEDNCECLCKTCETRGVNGWAQNEGTSPLKTSIEEISEGYSLRRRRRDDSCASASRTPSVTPDIRPRVRKTKLKSLGSPAERSSFFDSPTPQSLLREKRKREIESLSSPPTTPAKRLKTFRYEIGPIPAPGSLQRRDSNDATSSEHSVSDSASTDPMVMTDATTPEEYQQETALQSPALTPIKARDSILKQEDLDLTPLPSISCELSVSPALTVESLARHDGNASPTSTQAEVPVTVQGKVGELPRIDVMALPAPITAVSDKTIVVSDSAPTRGAIEHQSDAAVNEKPRRGRPRKGEAISGVDSVDDINAAIKKRTPGDYTLTPALLSEPSMAWIYCTICGDAFVQQNAYFTRSSCFRCERHSKLYGYIWPKTEKEGPNDKEERVLDHRTVHRFLDPEDEAKSRGRKLATASVLREERTESNPTDATPPGRRGPGRPRKYLAQDDGVQAEEESPSRLRRTSRRTQRVCQASMC
ncbi:hypothetical protein F5Y18DRAFT_379415 [Xylariaceae sp. FL1019]|nr:hypothetical protein F5Y18DRAFT_379415 [Xylariaceae sp. FL1019]